MKNWGGNFFFLSYCTQIVDPSYGMYVWPCAPVLAQYVWFNRHNIRGKTVLEVSPQSCHAILS